MLDASREFSPSGVALLLPPNRVMIGFLRGPAFCSRYAVNYVCRKIALEALSHRISLTLPET